MAAFLFHFRNTMALLLHQPTCQTLFEERLLHIRFRPHVLYCNVVHQSTLVPGSTS